VKKSIFKALAVAVLTVGLLAGCNSGGGNKNANAFAYFGYAMFNLQNLNQVAGHTNIFAMSVEFYTLEQIMEYAIMNQLKAMIDLSALINLQLLSYGTISDQDIQDFAARLALINLSYLHSLVVYNYASYAQELEGVVTREQLDTEVQKTVTGLRKAGYRFRI